MNIYTIEKYTDQNKWQLISVFADDGSASNYMSQLYLKDKTVSLRQRNWLLPMRDKFEGGQTVFNYNEKYDTDDGINYVDTLDDID